MTADTADPKAEIAEFKRRLRFRAFGGVVLSFISLTTCLLVFPLLFYYVQKLQSSVHSEVQFCKVRIVCANTYFSLFRTWICYHINLRKAVINSKTSNSWTKFEVASCSFKIDIVKWYLLFGLNSQCWKKPKLAARFFHFHKITPNARPLLLTHLS